MCYGEFLWTIDFIYAIHNRVRETIKVINAKIIIAMRAALLIFNEQIAHALELSKEGGGNQAAGMRRVIHRSIPKLCFSIGVNPMLQTILALTRANGSG